MSDHDWVSLFNQYLEKNRKMWQAFSPADELLTDKSIIVDMLVGHPGYLIGNALIAKYLQKEYHYRIIGLVRSQDAQLEMALGNSFGFHGFLYHNTQISLNVNLDPNSMFNGLSLEQQRQKLIDFTVNEVQIGDLAYDSYLRSTGQPTVTTIDEQVLAHLQQTIRDYVMYQQMIKGNNIAAAVVGHTVYSMYGTLARAVIAEGGCTYSRKKAAGPLTIRRNDNLQDIKKNIYNFTNEEFEQILAEHQDAAVRWARDYFNKRITQSTGEYTNTEEAYGKHKKMYRKDGLLKQLGMDSSKPTVFIMAQIFADAPHNSDFRVYADYYQWLINTLEIAKGVDDVNWLVKAHPNMKHWDNPVSTENVINEYLNKHSNIALVPDDINTACLYDIAHAIVTVSGSAGLEFPVMGVPTINAGSTFYTGLGFNIEPKSVEEYEQTLKNIAELQPLSEAQVNRALTYAWIYFDYCQVESAFMPDMPAVFWEKKNDCDIWKEALQGLETSIPERDLLYQNFMLQLRHKRAHLLKIFQ